MSVLRGRLPPRRPNSPQSMAGKITRQRSCEGITIMMYVNEQNFGLGPLVVVLALHAVYFRDAPRSRDRVSPAKQHVALSQASQDIL